MISIGCQYCRAKGRQPQFNAQVALHNYVNKIIRDTVPQKNLLGNVEITVIRVNGVCLLRSKYSFSLSMLGFDVLYGIPY
jgi:hypothetical protein